MDHKRSICLFHDLSLFNNSENSKLCLTKFGLFKEKCMSFPWWTQFLYMHAHLKWNFLFWRFLTIQNYPVISVYTSANYLNKTIVTDYEKNVIKEMYIIHKKISYTKYNKASYQKTNKHKFKQRTTTYIAVYWPNLTSFSVA